MYLLLIPDATLTVADRTNGDLGPTELLRIKASDHSGNAENNPQWHFGQVAVGQNAQTTFNVSESNIKLVASFAVRHNLL